MSESKLIELGYYDPSAKIRLSAYTDKGVWKARRFRAYIWKQWEVPKVGIRNLMKLDIPKYSFYRWWYVKACWDVAGDSVLT